MKGIIFTEFLEMVEEKFSPEMVEEIINDSNLPNQGAYTQVGTYDHEEIVRLIISLSKRTGISVEDLQKVFGEHLFGKFVIKYHSLIADVKSAFELFKQVDAYIHVEVLKLYPDAELPRFQCKEVDKDRLEMLYLSNHPFSDLAYGLIKGCISHFKENISIQAIGLPSVGDKKHQVLFALTRQI